MPSVIKAKNKIFFIFILCFLLVIVPLFSHAITLDSVPNPRTTNGSWVSDFANVLSQTTESSINQKVSNLEAQNGTEIAVVTVPETESFESPKEFTTKLFNTWKIGKIEQNNGVLFLVSVADRRVEIETGRGIENLLTNAKIKGIIQKMIPHFKREDFDTGILLGTTDIIEVLEQNNFRSYYPVSRRNTALEIPSSFQNNLFLLISGLIGGLHYYRILFKTIKPIYLEPEGYSKNKSISALANKWLIYISMYLCVVFISVFAIAPIITAISQKLAIILFSILYFYWISSLKKNPPSLTKLLLFISAPFLLVIAYISISSSGTAFPFLMIYICYNITQKKKQEEKVPNTFWLSLIFSYVLIILAGFFLVTSFQNSGEKFIIFLSLASSSASSYLVWEYCQRKFKLFDTAKIRCSCCQQSLNKIESSSLHKYLSRPQKVAQTLGNVNYQAWECNNCYPKKEFKAHIFANVTPGKLLNNIAECPTCEELTIAKETEVLKSATRWKKGVLLNKYVCQCCEYSREEKQVIPRKSSSKRNNSSSSSSYNSSYSSYSDSSTSYGGGSDGGSDFGGGGSDGGGAGGDW